MPSKKELDAIIKGVRDCKIEEVCFDNNLNITLVPYKEESQEELERIADIEGKLCPSPVSCDKIKLQMQQPNTVNEIEVLESI